MAVPFKFVMVLALAVTYATSVAVLRAKRSPDPRPELLVTLPLVAQVMFTMGDRHLAANLLGFRVLVAETFRMNAADFAVQARLQTDLSLLNPAHEDNYYVAAAFLPWEGRLPEAITVLERATAARPFDFLPVFHLGFLHFHFLGNPGLGAEFLLRAAARTKTPEDQWGLQNMAARWAERGYDLATAVRVVGSMAKSVPPGGFRRYLERRAGRLQTLLSLREAAAEFRQREGRSVTSLDELVAAGLIERIPADPLKAGFVVRADGEIIFGKGTP